MKSLVAGIAIPGALALVGVLAVVLWARVGPSVDVTERVPGMDEVPPPPPAEAATRPVPGTPVASEGRPSSLPGAWPWFRGPNRDAIADDGVRLARRWPAGRPPRLWEVDMGPGYAAAAVHDGRVYVLDHVHDDAADLLRGLSAAEREKLADALAAADPADPEALANVLGGLFPIEGQDGGNPRPHLTQEQFDALRSLVGDAAADGRDKLLSALRLGQIDRIDRSADTMRCLSLDDGREIWRNGYRVVVPMNHGMSRTTPAVVGGVVVSLGPKCQVVGWDAATGEALWLMDLVLDYGATVPPWYAGQCPLVDDVTDRLILAPGGRALLIAVDYRTGKVIWESANPRAWTMTHTSIVPMEIDGRRQYVYCGKGGVAGVAADDGSILWDTTAWKIGMATCPSPVVIGDGRIFLSGGYNAGAMMLRVVPQGGAFRADVMFQMNAKAFGSEQQTPVLYDGYLYGVRQRDGQLVCLDLDGNQRWASGRDKFGAAPYMIADGLILAMDDAGRLTMAEATSEGYRPLGQAQVIEDGIDSWGPMALVGGRLIVRDLTRMVCIDVSEH